MKHVIITLLLLAAFLSNATANGALDRTGWTATSSERLNSSDIPNMFDDDLDTQWSSLNVLEPGDWMIIDMKSKQAFNQIVMDQTVKPGDHPEGFAVYVSDDAENWSEAVATGKGTNGADTKITFPEKAARYIKIELTESKGAYWAVTELYVNLVDNRATWTATICDRLQDAYPSSADLPNMFDGNLETEWSSTAELKDGDWMIIDMKEARTFNQIIFDQTKTPGDCPNDFAAYVSNDGEDWGEAVATGRGTGGPQTAITFEEQTARYIKIELGQRGAYWNVTEFYANLIELPYRFGWTATICDRLQTAYPSSGNLPNMFDGNLETEWSSTTVLEDGDWMIIDMKAERTFNQIILDQTKAPGDCPDDFAVYVSNDGENWGEPVAEGRGTSGPQTTINFWEQSARYIKIELGQRGAYWNVTEFHTNLVERDHRFGWSATTSLNSKFLANMFDNELTTDWISERILEPGDWLMIDMKSERTFNQLVFIQANTPGDCPANFDVYVSQDGENWDEAVATGKGVEGPQTDLIFWDQTARYIKIVLTESTEVWWKITEFHANRIELPYRFGWTATICDRLQDAYPSSADLPNMFDGNPDTEWSSTAELKDGDWMIIDMQSERTFNQIVFDQTKTPGDCPDDFAVFVSNDGENWGEAVAEGSGTSGPETAIAFAEQTARYIKIELGQRGAYWKVTEFHINTVLLDYRFGWKITTSDRLNSNNTANMLDGSLETDWSSLNILEPGDWMIIDMLTEQSFNLIAMDQTKNEGDHPEGFAVYTSNDPENWGQAVAEGKGTNGAQTVITFDEQKARYIKIELTEAKEAYWAITELNVKTGDYRYGWTATTSERLNSSDLPYMLDDNLDTQWSSLNVLEPGDWMIIDMKAAQTFDQIVMDQTIKPGDHAEGFVVYASNDPENWGQAIATTRGTNGAATTVNFPEKSARYIKIELTEAKGAYWAVTEFHINLIGQPDSVEKPTGDNMQVYYSNGQIHLIGVSFPSVLNIYNLLGQRLKTTVVNQNVTAVDLAAGVYIITVNNHAFSCKLLVK